MLKESKIRVLENFYALDYVLFGKPVSEMKSCCPLVKEEYLSVKGALLSVYIEMLKLAKHSPKPIQEKVNSTGLVERAKTSAILAKEQAEKVITTNKSKTNIKESLRQFIKENKDVDVNKLVEDTIANKAFSLAIDNLLVARTLIEAKAFSKLNEWEGKIIEDSYKILRDNLIESARAIIESDAEGESEEETEKEDEPKDEPKKDDVKESFDLVFKKKN